MKVGALEWLEAMAWYGAPPRNFDFLIKCQNFIIWKKNLVDLKARGLNFVEFKSGGLHEKHAVPTWNLRNISAFAWRRRKTVKPVSSWPGAGLSGCALTSSQQSGLHGVTTQKMVRNWNPTWIRWGA
jgi:hypothetical protein